MLTQFIKFALVGMLNTVIHYAVFYYLYSYMGLHHLIASTTGFCFAVTNSFIINKHWTFQGRGENVRHQFSKFLIVSMLSLLINLGCMAILVELLFINPLLAQFVAIGFTLIVNFTGQKFWSFKL